MQETWVQFLGQKDPPKKGNLTDRGAWQATVHGFRRVRHDLATQLPHLICMCPENTSCIECGLTRSEGYQVKGAMPRRPTHTQGRRLLPLLLLTHPPWKESQLLFPHPLPRNHLHCFSQDDKQAEVSLKVQKAITSNTKVSYSISYRTMIFSLPFTEGYKQKMIHYSTQILQSGPIEFKPSLSGKHSAVGALQCPSHWTPNPHSKRLLLELHGTMWTRE